MSAKLGRYLQVNPILPIRIEPPQRWTCYALDAPRNKVVVGLQCTLVWVEFVYYKWFFYPPSGHLTVCYGKWPVYSWFTEKKKTWQFSCSQAVTLPQESWIPWRHQPVSSSFPTPYWHERTGHQPQHHSGWWCNNHLEKYEFVNGKDDIPYIYYGEKACLKPPTSYAFGQDVLGSRCPALSYWRGQLIALAKTPLASSTQQLKSIRTNSIQQKMKQKLVKIKIN